MTTPFSITDVPAIASELLAAMVSADLKLAQTLAARASSNDLLETAHACMRGRRWSDAAWLLEQVPDRDAAAEIQRCFARNLSALQTHRPEVYQTIVTLPAESRVGIGSAANGRPTIIVTRGDGQRVCLSPGNDPLANVLGAMRSLQPAMTQGLPLALCGAGDGYLLVALAQNPPELFLDMQQPVFLIEPDAQVLLHALMIHDYSGTQGPIQSARFQWFCGVAWRDDLQQKLLADPFLPCPAITISQGLDAAAISAGFREVAQVMLDREARLKARVEAWYADPARETLASLLGPKRPRAPRVLLVTTRFSTVLQYSTRDAAAAFESLGWEARVHIEPSPAHRLLAASTRHALAEFKPDFVFQIDHLRHEHVDLFPASLPFACWIQDHLPNLRTPEVAARITANDFVLTDACAMYRSTFGYPERQCIPLTKLTKVPTARLAYDRPLGREMIFVSNASHVARRLLPEKLAGHGGTAQGRALLEKAGTALVDLYAAGSCVPTYYDLLAMLRSLEQRIEAPISAEEFDEIAAWLFHPLNDSLYRQQALGWARDAATDMGIPFAVYGKGWEANPDFAPFARGPVQYGPELEALTRNARFNLQIVPYHCLHQRLLDGLIAGGFYLIRQHSADTAARYLIEFLLAHAPSATTLAAARHIVFKKLRPELDRLAEALRPAIATSDSDDPVEAVRHWRDMGLVTPGQEVLPHFGLTSFNDAASLRLAMARFAADPELSQEIAREQRDSVAGRFTYEAGLSRVIQQMNDLLDTPPAPAQPQLMVRTAISEQRLRRAV